MELLVSKICTNAFLNFNVERELVYMTGAQLAEATIVFLGDKHAADFLNQVRICCNGKLIVYN
jgi:hypothetical protein